jgi:hypothetical protein
VNIYRPLSDMELIRFLRQVNDYLLADPISWDSTMKEEYYDANPALTFLRLLQLPFDRAGPASGRVRQSAD